MTPSSVTLYECVILTMLGVFDLVLNMSHLMCYKVVCDLSMNVYCEDKRVDFSRDGDMHYVIMLNNNTHTLTNHAYILLG